MIGIKEMRINKKMRINRKIEEGKEGILLKIVIRKRKK